MSPSNRCNRARQVTSTLCKSLCKFLCHPPIRGIIWAVVVAGMVTAIVVLLKLNWKNSAPTDKALDPSVVIGTFITLYGVFIAGFGGLAAFVAKRGHARDCLETLRVMAVAFLAGGTLLDLIRVLNSAGDLYAAAISKLSARTVNDIVYDFKVYFVVNVLIGAFGILVACLLARAEPFRKRK